MNTSRREKWPRRSRILAVICGIIAIITLPLCWILKDGLLGAYPSHGPGALSHLFYSLLWGVWPTAMCALLLSSAGTRRTRILAGSLLAVCLFFFLLPISYSRAHVPYWDSPFHRGSMITFWQQGKARMYEWQDETNHKENDRIWTDWECAHNSLHCWRYSRVTRPIAQCRLHKSTIRWDKENVDISTEHGTFTRARIEQDTRLLEHLLRHLPTRQQAASPEQARPECPFIPESPATETN